ncbi:MAG: sigma-70 family RNA polymerase sigma factor [Planctomycetes bacterium]|nr:sigma-70 family RNA polymerase sigma factor [Planctomycetota bacterium]
MMETLAMPATLDLEALLNAHQKGIWRYLRALGCETAMADDLTQETFLAVARKPFEIRDAASTGAYLRTVARHLLLKLRRRAGVEVATDEIDEIDTGWTRLNTDDSGDAMLAALRDCLRGLDEEARRALDMQFKAQASRLEIAKALGFTEDGIKTLLRRSKAKLRLCIERKVGHDQ